MAKVYKDYVLFTESPYSCVQQINKVVLCYIDFFMSRGITYRK